MHNINYLDYSCLINNEKKCSVYTKLVLQKDSKVYDIVKYPNKKFIFVGSRDGAIKLFDYSIIKNIKNYLKSNQINYRYHIPSKTQHNFENIMKIIFLYTYIKSLLVIIELCYGNRY